MNIKEKIINALGGLTKEQSAKLAYEQALKLTNENRRLRETLRINEKSLRRLKENARTIETKISTPGDAMRLFTALMPFVKYSKGENSTSTAYITVLDE